MGMTAPPRLIAIIVPGQSTSVGTTYSKPKKSTRSPTTLVSPGSWAKRNVDVRAKEARKEQKQRA